MPLTEKEVGISEFLCQHQPFQAILKHTIDDFLVNEVACDGTVVYQKVLGLPKLPKKVAQPLKSPVIEGKSDENPCSESAGKVPVPATEKESTSNPAQDGEQMKVEGKTYDVEMKREISKDEDVKDELKTADMNMKKEPLKDEDMKVHVEGTDEDAKVKVEQKDEDMKVEMKSSDAGTKDENMGTEVKDTKEVKALNIDSRAEKMNGKETEGPADTKVGNNGEIKEETNGLVSDTKGETGSNAGPKDGAKSGVNEESSLLVFKAADFAALDLLFADASPATSIDLKKKLLSDGKFLLPVQADKGARTKAHQWVRENLTGYFSQTTKPASGEQRVEIVKKGQGRDVWSKREADAKRAEKAKEDPLWVSRKDIVQCTLWKRGRDTMETLHEIVRHFRIRPGQLSTAGTKDKRGITVQRLRVRGISIRKLVSINNSRVPYNRGRRCFALGDFEILRGGEAKPLVLGDLAGNRFTLVLRGISQEIPREEIVHALKNVEKYGFINYFGMQRFGSGAVPTHETGFALLRGDYKEAIVNILSPLTISPIRQGDTINPARLATQNGLRDFKAGKIKATRLLDVLPRWMHIEKSIVKSLCDDEVNDRELNYKKAFSMLQKNMKTMYIHAVQSYLWNCMASETISERKCREFAKEGDLITDSETLTSSTEVRKVTAEEESAKRVPLSKVILPVLGRIVTCEALGNGVKSILEKEKLDLVKMFADYDDDFRGTYRKLLSVPGDLKHEFKEYAQGSRYPLVRESVGTKEKKKHSGDKRTFGGDNSAPGSGEAVEKRRKMSVEMADAEEKGTGKDGVLKDGADAEMKASEGKIGEKEAGEAVENATGKTDDNDNKNEKAERKKAMDLALIVSFSLRTSSYATMLIRELTHCPTDTKYHKNLTVQQAEEAASKATEGETGRKEEVTTSKEN